MKLSISADRLDGNWVLNIHYTKTMMLLTQPKLSDYFAVIKLIK